MWVQVQVKNQGKGSGRLPLSLYLKEGQAGISELPTDVRGCSLRAYRGLSGLAHMMEYL